MPKGRTAKLFAISMTLLMTIAVSLMAIGLLRAWWSTPFPVLGFTNAPEQPLDFPHNIHVEQMGIQCEFCHRNVTKGKAATVPAVETCLFCHKDIGGGSVTAQEEIDKVRTAFDTGTPIDWERVHRLPDHVRFIHESHIMYFTDDEIPVKYGINGEELTQTHDVAQTCTICHGDVGNKVEVQPKTGQSLKMGTCLDCHRVNDAPTDCTTCHK